MIEPNSILVIGLGELGLEVVRSLAQHAARSQTQLAVLLRPSSNPARLAQLQQLESWKVDVVSCNVLDDSKGSLSTVFSKFGTVISCTGMTLDPSVQIKIAEAVLSAGVPRYFPWQFGIDYDIIGKGGAQDLFDSQLDVRTLLRKQTRTAWVIVSTGIFTSFVFEPAFGLVDGERRVVTAIGSWENELTATTPQDIGHVVAELVLAHPTIQGVVYVSGDTFSMRRLADVVEQVTGHDIERRLRTVPMLKNELAEDPTNAMKKYSVVFGEGRGISWPKSVTFNGSVGMKMQDIESWAQEHLQPKSQ